MSAQSVNFYKYQGTGNDFIIINDLENKLKPDVQAAAKLCDRHFGIGADGLILVKPSKEADFYMDFYNSDGSVAEVCGNGLRCLGAFAKEILMANDKDIRIDTLAGVKTVAIEDDGYTVDMGKPSFKAADIPADIEVEEVVDYPFEADGKTYNITCVSLGNPHTVIFGGELVTEEAEKIGPVIENSEEFPQRTNVEFVNLSNGVARAVAWERGAGLTMACGTGACAILAAANKLGLAEDSLTVHLPGGELNVKYDKTGSVLLTGPAEFVFKGIVEIS